MADERMQPMSCGHEVPLDEVPTHSHDTQFDEDSADERERKYLNTISMTTLGVAGLTAVAYGLARRRLNNKRQE